jgi:transposase
MTDHGVLATVKKAQVSYQGLQNLAFTFRLKFEQMANQVLLKKQEEVSKLLLIKRRRVLKHYKDKTNDGMQSLNNAWIQLSDGAFNSFKTKEYDDLKDQVKESDI